MTHIFQKDNTQLPDKILGLCQKLRNRSAPPNLDQMEVSDDDCTKAGSTAQDYSTLNEFKFANVSQDKIDGRPFGDDGKLLAIKTRGQVWLNKSIIAMAASLGQMLKQSSGANDTSSIFSSKGDKSLDKLAKVQITQKEPLKFDANSLEFYVLLHMDLTGAVQASHDIAINGKLLDGSFAVRVDTVQDMPYEKSIMKNFKILVIGQPHAGDIYVDAFVQATLYSLGIDKVLANQFSSAIGGSFKTMLDTLGNVNSQK